ncbi:hypothetical protein QW060_21645 [Myroides ceti]|uniref:Uncharacterized protein n=1 Tax=Paenimyroides ceti TaxID=395087 RepID=A0ABT8CZ41_9FLAO|nr:hypothetical protein [Paenimyroides ceti]MDN3709577.1 hypothetical protein [Paenimyroides ceti]
MVINSLFLYIPVYDGTFLDFSLSPDTVLLHNFNKVFCKLICRFKNNSGIFSINDFFASSSAPFAKDKARLGTTCACYSPYGAVVVYRMDYGYKNRIKRCLVPSHFWSKPLRNENRKKFYDNSQLLKTE